MTLLRRITVLCVFGYLVLLMGMGFFQRSLLYFPHSDIKKPAAYGLSDFTDTRLTSKDGIRVRAWYHEARPGWPTVMFYHGNGGHLGHRASLMRAFADAGFGMLGLDYRGYGKSEGSPSEQGIYGDARAAMRYLIQKKEIPERMILLYGESLGTGVAVQMATEFKVGGLVLQSPYLSVTQRAQELYPYLPVSLVLRDRYESAEKLAKIHCPLLIFHGDRDQVIPIAHGKKLLAQANEPKTAHFFEGVGHNNFDVDVLAQHLKDFARDYGLIR